MELINKNPFRIIGLPANCKEKDLQRQRAKFNALINIKREINTEFDFPFLYKIPRDELSINSSFATIENKNQKLLYSLFWFVSFNNSDNLAFEYLSSANLDKAIDIWSKVCNSISNTPRKLSALNNLGTLTLELSFLGKEFDLNLFRQSILLKRELLESDFFSDFAIQIANDESNAVEVSKNFLDVLLSDSAISKINELDLLSMYSDTFPEVRSYLKKRIVTEPLNIINDSVEESENKRYGFPEKAASFGEKLYRKTRKYLEILKEVYDSDSVEYEMYADKVALEIFLCGRDYFNHYFESEKVNPAWRIIRLFQRAKSISVSNSLLARINENIAAVREYQEEREEKEKFNDVESEFEQLQNYLEQFKNKRATFQNASALALNCRPLLDRIKEKLGKTDELYLKFSSLIVRNSQGMMAQVINQANKNFYDSLERKYVLGGEMNAVISALDDANRLKNILHRFDMDSETREFFNQNNRTLDTLYLQFLPREPVKPSPPPDKQPPSRAKINQRNDLFSSASLDDTNRMASILKLIIAHPFISLIVLAVGGLWIGNLIGNTTADFNTNKLTNTSFNSNILKTNTVSNISNTTSGRGTGSGNFNQTVVINSIPSDVKTTRPKNGETIFVSSRSKGYGSLLIENGTRNDAIAKLVDLNTGKTYKQIYIQAGNNFTINGIKSGTFVLKFSLGKNYSAETKRFTIDESFEKFDEILDFTVNRTANGVQWSNYRATLNPVTYGTATTSRIDANDFADK